MPERELPNEKHLNLFYSWNHVEEDATANFAKILQLCPQLRTELLTDLLDEFDSDFGDIQLREHPQTEVSVEREPTDETYLLGLAQNPEDMNLDDLSGSSDKGGRMDLVLKLESEDTVFDVVVEVKTGGSSLGVSQMSKYATHLQPEAVETVSWKHIYDTVEETVSNLRSDKDSSDIELVTAEHYLEYLDSDGFTDRKITLVADQHWSSLEGDDPNDGRDQIRLEYVNDENLYVVFESATERYSEGENNSRYRKRLRWQEFESLFADVEECHPELLREAFVGDRESGVGGLNAIRKTVSGTEVLGEIDAVDTCDSNYLRLFYDQDEDRLRLREVQPSKGESPDTKGSPAGGGEIYIWELADGNGTDDELTQLLDGESNSFDYNLRKSLFIKRDKERVLDKVINQKR